MCLRTTEQLAAQYLLSEELDPLIGPSHRFASVLALKTPYCEVASTHVLKMVDE